MSYRFNLDRVCMSPRLFRKVIEVDHEQIYDEFDDITTSAINDLLHMRQFKVHNFTESEINNMLDYVCTS